MKKDRNLILKSAVKTRKGFSLLELITIIAIIAIMTSIVLLYGNDEAAEKKLEIAARQVESTIKQAHSNALTGKSATGSCSYRFFHTVLPFPATSYGISGCQTLSYNLEGGIYFFNNGVPNDITFSIPHGSVISTNKDLRIVLRTTAVTGISRVICVNSRGAIKILNDEALLCD